MPMRAGAEHTGYAAGRCRRGIDAGEPTPSRQAREAHATSRRKARRSCAPSSTSCGPWSARASRSRSPMRRRMGDRSENAEYIYGKRRLREIDRRVRFLSKRLDEVRVVSEPPSDPKRVFFGAWVTIEDEDGAEKTYRIVGADESDSSSGCISIDSPVATRAARQARGRRGHGAASPRATSRTRSRGWRTRHDRARPRGRARAASPSRSRMRRRKRDRGRAAARARAVRAHRSCGGAPAARSPCCATAARPIPRCSPRSPRRSESICFETYILAADATGDRFKAALIERATRRRQGPPDLRRGRLVRPARELGRRPARTPGSRSIDFNPIAPWRRRFRLSHRDHRKILVVDDQVAFTGGLNIANDYAAVDDGGAGWHDMHCRVTGPIVRDLARMFRRTWLRAGGARFPAVPPAIASPAGTGTAFVRLLDNTLRRQRGTIRRAYLHVIRAARERGADPERVLPARPRRAAGAGARRDARRRRAGDGAGPLRRARDRVGEPLRAARPRRGPASRSCAGAAR